MAADRCSRSLFQFTFAKIWLLFAQFEVRQKNLQNARKVMVSFKHLNVVEESSGGPG